ncbi:hypothetical protein HpVa149_03460 [Helicobacter pylori]
MKEIFTICRICQNSKELKNELLSQFDEQALTNALKQEIKNDIRIELDDLLSGSEVTKRITKRFNA